MVSIGEKIRIRREELGMSQDELADKMGYKSRSTIAKIEKGVNDVVQTNIVKFAKVLNTSVAYLMGWEEENEKTTDEYILTDGEKNLIQLFRAIPDDKKQMAIEMLKAALQIK